MEAKCYTPRRRWKVTPGPRVELMSQTFAQCSRWHGARRAGVEDAREPAAIASSRSKRGDDDAGIGPATSANTSWRRSRSDERRCEADARAGREEERRIEAEKDKHRDAEGRKKRGQTGGPAIGRTRSQGAAQLHRSGKPHHEVERMATSKPITQRHARRRGTPRSIVAHELQRSAASDQGQLAPWSRQMENNLGRKPEQASRTPATAAKPISKRS